MNVPGEFVDEAGVVRFEGHIAGTGITDATNTNVGAVLVLATPVQIGAGGPIIQAGAGAPGVGGNVGDVYINQTGSPATDTLLYGCTVAGGAGAATWVALVTS